MGKKARLCLKTHNSSWALRKAGHQLLPFIVLLPSQDKFVVATVDRPAVLACKVLTEEAGAGKVQGGEGGEAGEWGIWE